MQIPHSKEELELLNEPAVPLHEMRKLSMRSLFGIHFAQILLFLGLLLIFLNNIGVLYTNSYFGDANWLTILVFSIGIVINFFSIPWLYFSSFQNFKKDVDFWDKEMFWILPLFFFGTFFLYESRLDNSLALFVLSLLCILVVHIFFIIVASKHVKENEGDLHSHRQYLSSLAYLSAYYMLFLTLLVVFNPLEHLFFWVRNNYFM